MSLPIWIIAENAHPLAQLIKAMQEGRKLIFHGDYYDTYLDCWNPCEYEENPDCLWHPDLYEENPCKACPRSARERFEEEQAKYPGRLELALANPLPSEIMREERLCKQSKRRSIFTRQC